MARKFWIMQCFRKQNYMEYFLDEDGIQKQFFKEHSLKNCIPKTIEDCEKFFKNVNVCIIEHGKFIVKYLNTIR